MKRFCQLITVLALVVIGIGFYRGWFSLSGGGAGTGNVEVKLSVDTDKVKHDTGTVSDAIQAKDSRNEH